MVKQRGEIWWARLPQPQGSGPGYRRPVLVIQAEEFNQTALRTIIVAAITSQLRALQTGNSRELRRLHCGQNRRERPRNSNGVKAPVALSPLPANAAARPPLQRSRSRPLGLAGPRAGAPQPFECGHGAASVSAEQGQGPAPVNVLCRNRYTGLPKDSVVNVTQVAALDRQLFLARVNQLPSFLLQAVDAGLRLVLAL
ncbi:MAG: type II toxin-antitoxin system PemK/MazF family toxin [Terriglobales bacterium]